MGEGDKYLIWSNERHAWLGPNRMGYVHSIREAGRYSRREAIILSAQAVPGSARRMGLLPELPVHEADLVSLADIVDPKWRDSSLF